MLGPKSELIAAAVTFIALIAAVTDLRSGKIYNWLTIPAWACGIAASIAIGSWQAGLESLGASMVGLVLFGWMFPLRLMGAGDVKFLMALGAWGGFSFVIQTALFSILVGGAFAAVILIFKGRMRGFLEKIQLFAISAASREVKIQPPKLDRELKMPFGVPMAVAAAWLAWGRPLEWLGIWRGGS